MAPKFLQNIGPDTELNRVQANVAEALRLLQDSVTREIAAAIAAIPAAGGSPVIATFGAQQTENATRYMSVGGLQFPFAGGTIATTDSYWPVPVAGTVTRLQIQLSIALASNAGTVVFTVRKRTAGATADTTMTLTLTCAPLTGTLVYLTTVANPFTVAVGDSLSIKLLDSGLSAAVQAIVATLTLEP